MDTQFKSPVDVPTSAIWVFLALAFGLILLILAVLLLWQDAIEQVFGPLSASHPLFILAVWSPAISAWAVILYTTGWSGFRGYLSRFRVWQCGIAWALTIFVVIPLIYYVGAWMKGTPSYTPWPFETIQIGLSAIGLMAILGPIEEFGWRDVMQPLLQRKHTPFVAAILVGCAWGIWHLPAFFLSGLPQSNWDVLPFLIGVIAISVIITPLFNQMRGGILLPMVFHFQLNNPMWPDAMPFDIPLFVLLAAGVTYIYRVEMFDTRSGVTRVTGLQASAVRLSSR
jgi:membrane protease YdiL (CAAX protease family)